MRARMLLILAVVFFMMTPSASATLRGIEPNVWDYTPEQFAEASHGLNPEVARIEHQWNAPLVELDTKIQAGGATPIILLDGTTSPNPTTYAARAAEVALRYRYANRGIEVWNEENTERFWGGTPSSAEYATLLRAAHAAIKEVAPETRVIAGAAAPTIDHVAFMQQVLALVPADAVAVHPYADTPAQSVAQVQAIRAITLLPLVVTEFGWGTSCLGAFCVSEETQVNYLIEALRGYHALGYVTDATAYMLHDSPNLLCERFDCRSGLVRADGSLKPAYTAYRDIVLSSASQPVVSPQVVARVTMRLRRTAPRRVRARGVARGCVRVRINMRRGHRHRRVFAAVETSHYRRDLGHLRRGRYYVRAHCAGAVSRRQTFRIPG